MGEKKDTIFHLEENHENPLRNDAFLMSDEEKINQIEKHFFHIMEILGLDMNNDSLRSTPRRVAKMFIQEIFSGINPKTYPKVSTFENKYQYNQMLIEKNITIYSTCEHHFLPIVGKAHVGYISNGKVIGLSKINRIVNYYAKRPQVQERLTIQIVKSLQKILETKNVACVIEAKHLCVNSRGIRDIDTRTITAELVGNFKNNSEIRREFFHYIGIS
ncbi:MAG: GTP cyclohydrolase I FolE [Flavobacteriales bacterium]|jgi:GTP cyclohydrolase I|uniref:GTP cyclohydrolase I FolE n=1 Tax=Blattabacterium sp. (Mastotermes darwiniensis) TaxID=39768 RepID=UPI000231DE1E|nr:GTP cyclohydrolase I FolE [Blattabacterium sp. (Mastotermes darwiniensis)]AER40594.1 GTP cyclohydrolase I [Blattabacterium sp. (Mastotermes darwiniensis) str. MADAR]MDR1805091.1 GTP cyclohydrolase I FolE [Flavobacteriales bacterium]